MYEQMIQKRQFLISEIEKCHQEISKLPDGKLSIAKNNQFTKWYVYYKDKERALLPKKETQLASDLARKRILEETMKEYQQELKAVDRYLSLCVRDEDSFYSTPEFHLYNSLILDNNLDPTDKAFQWANSEYRTNEYHPENKIHPGASGKMLRSLSEAMIDVMLTQAGIPFRYENEIVIDNTPFYIDFTIYKAKTEEFRYWEHNGMMDVPDYYKRAFAREEKLCSAGIIPGINLINTYATKSSPLTYTEIARHVEDLKAWLEA